MRSLFSRLFCIISLISLAIPTTYAVTYPVGTPASETTGGYFNTYFTNMFTDCYVWEVLYGFGLDGTPHCQIIPTAAVSNATLSLSGSLVGTPNYVAKYTPTGTGINNSQIYDDGTNVGVGTATPGARLEINWQVKITGGTPGTNRVLTSDATGLAYWSSSVAGATATGITGGVANYVSKFGTGGIGLYPSQFFDNGTNIGIGTAVPGAKLDIAGTIRITGGGFASGRVLTSDATGLASWQPSVSTADFALSGAFWRQTGNSGTTSATDYVGTADNQDLVFRRNSIEGMRLSGASSNLVTIADATINWVTVGRGAGNIATNTANGYNALYGNITGYQNTAVGMSSLYSNNTGYNNTALGYLAGANLTSGNNNIFIWYNTQPNIGNISSNQLNIGNVIYGYNGNIGIGVLNPIARLDIGGNIKIADGTQWNGRVLTSDTGGIATWQIPAAAPSTTTLGLAWPLVGTTNYIAKYTPTGTGINNSQIFDDGTNVGIGTNVPLARLDVPYDILINWYRIGRWGGSMPGNTAIGRLSLQNNSSGNYNTANWYDSLVYNTTGNYNTANGISSLWANTLGTNNTANGAFALQNNTLGSYNTAIGSNAWQNLGSGSYNIAIGAWVNLVSATWSNQLNIGNWIYGNSGSIGIGTTSPTALLDVNWQIRMRSGSASGYYLISDALGIASWAAPIATGLSISGSVLGSTLYYNGTTWVPSVNIYNSGSNIGIGTSTPSAKLTVSGSALITGDITVQGKVITDTIVNRTVANVTISGSLLPDVWAPAMYRDIGSVALPWQNLYLSNQIRIAGGSPGLGKILTSDASGLATWMTGFSGTTTATGITGGSGYYMPYFGTGGTGLYPTSLYYSWSRIGMNTINPQYMFDIRGSGSILNTGSWLCINDICISSWTGLNNLVRSSGTPNYISKFDSGGLINNSQLYETGWKLYIGDITGILWWAATLGYITVEALGSTNSTNPMLTLSENGWQECRMWINGVNKMWSNCAWSAGVSWLGFLPNQMPRADVTLWDALTGSVMYNVGNFVGIGTSSPTTTLTVSGTVRITGGVPWAGKILTSDATGLATWSSSLSGATATGITGGVENYISKFGTGGTGLYASQIFDNGTNIGVGTGVGLTTKFVIDSGIANDSGLRFARINLSTPLTSNNVLVLGVDWSGKVMPISPISNIAVYTGTLRNSPPTPNPDLTTFNVSYDFNQYFAIPGKQSFVVSKGDGPSNNGPYFKEDGTDALCSITGTYGSPGAYDCANADPVTGLSASPYNSFTMSAKWDTFGYQLALGARGDAPLFARSGRFNWASTGWLYTNDSPYQTPAPWQRVLSIPANHSEYLYINTGLNSQLQAISGGGQVGIGTSFPDRHFVVAGSPSWSTSSAVPQMMIKRWIQWADANLSVAYGTPYLNIWWLENRLTALQTIGFGYSGLAGTTRYAPAEIWFITTSTTGNTQGDIVFANRSTTTNIAPVEVVRIMSSGSVGIGTSTPSSLLDVDGAVRALGWSLFNGSNWYLFSSPGDTDGGMFSPADGTVVFATNNTERMRIDASGNVGIGTSPTSKLDVAGTFELGTNGTQLNAFIKVAPTVDIASIAASACLAQTFTATNAAIWWVATISPTSALADRMIIAYTRVSAANTVEAKFCNVSAAAIDLPSMIYYISVIQ